MPWASELAAPAGRKERRASWPMLVSLERAREALGATGARLSDPEVLELCREAEAVARWLERRAIEQKEEEMRRSVA